MDKREVYRAREIARNAGYDPDQLVIEIDKARDFDLLTLGLAPVEIPKIKPVYMKFYDQARRAIHEEEMVCG